MRPAVIHLSAVLKSDFVMDESKKPMYRSCSTWLSGRRKSRRPYCFKNCSAHVRSALPAAQGKRVVRTLPVTAVPTDRAVSRRALARWLPTSLAPSLSKPSADTVSEGRELVHCPAGICGKTSESVRSNSARLSRRRSGVPRFGWGQLRTKAVELPPSEFVEPPSWLVAPSGGGPLCPGCAQAAATREAD